MIASEVASDRSHIGVRPAPFKNRGHPGAAVGPRRVREGMKPSSVPWITSGGRANESKTAVRSSKSGPDTLRNLNRRI